MGLYFVKLAMEKAIKGAKVWLIRHGYSTFNAVKDAIKKDPKIPYDRFTMDLVDAALHEKGIAQAKEAQKDVNDKNITYVFVSPMQRAIETSYHMFNKHPNIGKIKFIVHPLLREILNNSNDVPNATLKRLRPKYETLKDYNYDFTAFDSLSQPELYYILSIEDPIRSELLSKIKKDDKGEYNDLKVCLEKAREIYPGKMLESEANVFKRVQEFKAFLANFIKVKGIEKEEIAVVTHSEVIIQALSKPGEHEKFPLIKNCAVFSWEIQSTPLIHCLLYTSPSPRDATLSRMPSSA
eukprot:TRINITY_DN1037_c0_g3_i1.p1 TRINITY_DN1037_c0_g3~~TRINITY_DN1037_c0_g3_i1.p1  ORF type:complete len:295 (+),score=66.27 TRINITY_DN1037_c0_g3_i1:3-887(+)